MYKKKNNMVDLEMITELYASVVERVESAREHLGHPMTLTEKILYSHLHQDTPIKSYKRGEDYVNFAPDRVTIYECGTRQNCCPNICTL